MMIRFSLDDPADFNSANFPSYLDAVIRGDSRSSQLLKEFRHVEKLGQVETGPWEMTQDEYKLWSKWVYDQDITGYLALGIDGQTIDLVGRNKGPGPFWKNYVISKILREMDAIGVHRSKVGEITRGLVGVRKYLTKTFDRRNVPERFRIGNLAEVSVRIYAMGRNPSESQYLRALKDVLWINSVIPSVSMRSILMTLKMIDGVQMDSEPPMILSPAMKDGFDIIATHPSFFEIVIDIIRNNPWNIGYLRRLWEDDQLPDGPVSKEQADSLISLLSENVPAEWAITILDS